MQERGEGGKEEEREERQSGERILKFSLRKMNLVFFFFLMFHGADLIT